MSTIEQQIAYWQGKIENWANILKTTQIPSDHGKSESEICDDEQFRYQNAIIEIHRETKALISFFQALSELIQRSSRQYYLTVLKNVPKLLITAFSIVPFQLSEVLDPLLICLLSYYLPFSSRINTKNDSLNTDQLIIQRCTQWSTTVLQELLTHQSIYNSFPFQTPILQTIFHLPPTRSALHTNESIYLSSFSTPFLNIIQCSEELYISIFEEECYYILLDFLYRLDHEFIPFSFSRKENCLLSSFLSSLLLLLQQPDYHSLVLHLLFEILIQNQSKHSTSSPHSIISFSKAHDVDPINCSYQYSIVCDSKEQKPNKWKQQHISSLITDLLDQELNPSTTMTTSGESFESFNSVSSIFQFFIHIDQDPNYIFHYIQQCLTTIHRSQLNYSFYPTTNQSFLTYYLNHSVIHYQSISYLEKYFYKNRDKRALWLIQYLHFYLYTLFANTHTLCPRSVSTLPSYEFCPSLCSSILTDLFTNNIDSLLNHWNQVYSQMTSHSYNSLFYYQIWIFLQRYKYYDYYLLLYLYNKPTSLSPSFLSLLLFYSYQLLSLPQYDQFIRDLVTFDYHESNDHIHSFVLRYYQCSSFLSFFLLFYLLSHSHESIDSTQWNELLQVYSSCPSSFILTELSKCSDVLTFLHSYLTNQIYAPCFLDSSSSLFQHLELISPLIHQCMDQLNKTT